VKKVCEGSRQLASLTGRAVERNSSWQPMIIAALIFAAIEMALLLYMGLEKIGSYEDFPLAVLHFAFNASFWIAFLILVALVIRASQQVPIKVLRIALLVCTFACLMFAQLFLICSWVFFSWTGSFVTAALARFSLHNFGQLVFHFLQMFPVQFGMGVLAAATVSLITLFVILRSRRGDTTSSLGSFTKAGLLCAIVAAAVAYVFHEHESDALDRMHPAVALIKGSFSRQHLRYDASLIEKMERRDNDDLKAKMYQVSTPVIVILLESMRRDLAFEIPSPIPFMRSLIGESFFFDKAYASSSHSSYADISIWYAQYPLRTPDLSVISSNREWRDTSVFRVFKDLGYTTGYISSQNEKWGGMINWLKVPEVDFFYHSEDYQGRTRRDHPLTKGLVDLVTEEFEKIARAGKIEDSETIAQARKWIEQLEDKQRFFLGMNLQNTHYSYVVPPGGHEPFQPSRIDFPTYWGVWPRDKVVDVKNRYFNAFFNVDLMIEQFVNFLKVQGIWDNCFFVLLGDNGEAFYEHWHANHGGAMHDEVMRTFCLIKPPRGCKVYFVQRPVSHIDIIPGLLDLMGISPPPSFQGISPFGNHQRAYVFMHGAGLIAQDGIVRWPWKLLVQHRPDQLMELYNLDEDPGEQLNEASRRPDLVSELLTKLSEWRRVQLTYHGIPFLYRSYYPPKIY